MKRWYAGDLIPVEIECPVPGWPNLDVNGRPQFVNTHFDIEADAWKIGRANANAGVSLARSDVQQAQANLDRAVARLTASVEALARLEHASKLRQESDHG